MLINNICKLTCNYGYTLNRFISTTSIKMVRKMIIEENDNVTVVKGVEIDSDRKQSLIQSVEKNPACPLCRLNLKNLSYTDILIIGQFVDKTGKMMPREDTQLCNRQYGIVSHLLYKAQTCRLLPRPKDWPEAAGTYDKLNSYYMYPYKRRDDMFWIVKDKYWK